jgi:hypothetical protein
VQEGEGFVIAVSFAAAACVLGAVYALATGRTAFMIGLVVFFVVFILLGVLVNGGRRR